MSTTGTAQLTERLETAARTSTDSKGKPGEVAGFDVDLEPSDHLAFLRYADRPGVVGVVGGILGRAGVNIAGMQVSRDRRGGHALVALSVDSSVPAEVLEEIRVTIQAETARAIDL